MNLSNNLAIPRVAGTSSEPGPTAMQEKKAYTHSFQIRHEQEGEAEMNMFYQ